MRAVLYAQFGERPRLATVPDPAPPAGGVVVEVKASGVCRSDWHGWMGHDPGIELPHVPGHEFAGVVASVGEGVKRFGLGDRVTVPFVMGCGTCPECRTGNQQVCRDQAQPGFTYWGSFAPYVAVHHADLNLVRLPDGLDDASAASLGCRFATAFRAVVDQGEIAADEWMAVHGCGGVGLSAVMIASALGARVVAVDIDEDTLELARRLGASATLDARTTDDVGAAVAALTDGGAHLSLDALGHAVTCVNSVESLRRLGRHVQVGLLVDDQVHPPIPMDRVVAHELRIVGSHGMPAHRYDAMLALIDSGRVDPRALLGRTIDLEASIDALVGMDQVTQAGVTVITEL